VRGEGDAREARDAGRRRSYLEAVARRKAVDVGDAKAVAEANKNGKRKHKGERPEGRASAQQAPEVVRRSGTKAKWRAKWATVALPLTRPGAGY